MAHIKISTTAAAALLSLSICFCSIDTISVIDEPALPPRPVNTAVVAGKRASLSCAASNGSLARWTRIDAKGSWKVQTILASDCQLNPIHKVVYGVEQGDGNEGRCDLVVKNASVENAAMYICSMCEGFEPAQSAQLAVLDSEPDCRIDNLEPAINGNVTLTCDVSYTDNISPMTMTWTGQNGTVIASSISETSAGRTMSSFAFTVPNAATLPRYTCTTAFSAPVGLPSTATNTPQLSFTWTSPVVTIKGWSINPLNTAGEVGQRVTLSCRRPKSDKIVWSFLKVNTTSPVTIAFDCKVFPRFGQWYNVDDSTGACHLVIDELSSAHAGTYTCQDAMSEEKPASAQLIVHKTGPNCTSSAVGSVAPGVKVQLACSVLYSGNLGPVVTWTNERGQVLDSSTETRSTWIVSRVSLTAVNPAQVITALTHFNAPTVVQRKYLVKATNAPVYTNSWNITLPNVDACLSNRCLKNEVCVDGVNSYTCNCAHGITRRPNRTATVLNIAVNIEFMQLFLDGSDVTPKFSPSNWYDPPRRLPSVPLPATTRVIAVKGKTRGGYGGILASSADGRILTGPAWKCMIISESQQASDWMTACFNDAAWPAPAMIGNTFNNFQSVYGNGISRSARPIWTNNGGSINSVYCRFNIK